MPYEHLKFWMQSAYESGVKDHPQNVMADLKITYQHATPQTVGDQWWFWNCENIPDPLPEFLEEFNGEPKKYIGWGLTEELAKKLTKSELS